MKLEIPLFDLVEKVIQGFSSPLIQEGAEVHVATHTKIDTVLLFNSGDMGVRALAAELSVAAVATTTTYHFGSIIAPAWFSHGSFGQLPP